MPTPAVRVLRRIGPIPIPTFPLKGKGTTVETNSHGKGNNVETSYDGSGRKNEAEGPLFICHPSFIRCAVSATMHHIPSPSRGRPGWGWVTSPPLRQSRQLWAKPGYGRRPVSRGFALWESSAVGHDSNGLTCSPSRGRPGWGWVTLVSQFSLLFSRILRFRSRPISTPSLSIQGHVHVSDFSHDDYIAVPAHGRRFA